MLTIDTRNSFNQINPIEVVAQSVQHAIALEIDKAEVDTIDFQTIFFGQKRVIDATVVNRGPYQRSFVVLPPRETEDVDDVEGSENDEEIFSVFPAEGLLNPHATMVLRFVFDQPVGDDNSDGLEHVFIRYSSIEVVETHQKLNFRLVGKGVEHQVSLSTIDFNFDRVSIREKSTEKFILKNLSRFLPVTYEIKPIAQFRFTPEKGNIKPMGEKEISVTFYPKNYGQFETSTSVVFCSGLARSRLNLAGICGHENESVEKQPFYEQDEDVKYRTMHPDTRYTFDLKEIKRRTQNKKEFLGYARNEREQREQRQKRKIADSKRREQAIEMLSRGGDYTESDIQEYIKMILWMIWAWGRRA